MKRNEDQENFDFYEEVGVSNQWRYEHRESLDSDDSLGLSQDSVRKLTEDIMNPLPPADEEKQ